jgi:hypothetical protein
VYALLVRWGLIEWLGLPDELVTYVVTALVTGIFYVILRVAERYWDKIGWLIGFAARPALYVSGQVLTTSVVSNAAGEVATEIVTAPANSTPRAEGGRASTEVILLAIIAGAVVLALLVGWDWIDFNNK